MSIISVDPITDPRWQRLLQRRGSSVFHAPAWMRVLTDTYGFDIRSQVLLDDAGEPQAGIPFCRIDDIRGQRIVVLPFSDYCDPLITDQAQWRCLIDSLLEEDQPITLRCVHNDQPLADERLVLMKQAKWHGLDLQSSLDDLWQRFPGSTRQAIKKAQQAGVTVRLAQGEEDLQAFFGMHLRTRKYKYRLIAQPYRFFESIWHHFHHSDEGMGIALMLAIYQNSIIGGVLFLIWREKFYYKFNASSSEHLVHRPNDLVIWEGIRYAKARGYTHFDFGLSDWDQEGLIRFKRKFATQEKTISFLRYTPERLPTTQEREAQEILTAFTNLVTDPVVPDGVTAKAGDILYRFFA